MISITGHDISVANRMYCDTLFRQVRGKLNSHYAHETIATELIVLFCTAKSIATRCVIA